MLTRPSDDLEHVRLVAHLYRLLLDRPADRGGLLHHAERLAAGETLPELAGAMLASGEGRAVWNGLTDPEIGWRIWCAARHGRSNRGLGRARFKGRWAAAGSLAEFVACLLRDDAVRAASVLPSLFPAGIDPAQDDLYRAWGYRLWSAEAERALSRRMAPLLPALALLAPSIGLTIELETGDRARELEATIASLREQTHRCWRLLLRGPLPPGFSVPADPRIAVAWREDEAMAERWIGWLRPGDTLSPASLALFALAAFRRPRAVLFYCDEDRREAGGLCTGPVLKTAWDADAAEHLDLSGGLALFRTRHLRRRGGLQPGLPAQRRLGCATRGMAEERIGHLPAVLFHRHGSCREAAAAVGSEPPAARPAVSVVVATRDRAELLERCVRSLRASTAYGHVEVVLVDNGSTEPDALHLLRQLEREGCRVLRRPGPFNWSLLNNDGVRATAGEIVVLMNNDVQCIEPGWLDEMVAACLRPAVGVVGALLLFEDGRVQHAGVVVGPGAQAAHAAAEGPLQAARWQNVAAVTGACMAFRRSVFDRLGGFNGRMLPVTWNDLDFCMRAREARLRVLLARRAVLVHRECGTRSPDSAAENQAQLGRACAHVRRRHRRALRADPFLNPQLVARSGGRLLDPAAADSCWPILRAGGR